MLVWMALDPEDLRVLMQESEFDDGAFPKGARGRGWEIRQGLVKDSAWAALLDARMSGKDMDEFHQNTWIASGGEDVWRG